MRGPGHDAEDRQLVDDLLSAPHAADHVAPSTPRRQATNAASSPAASRASTGRIATGRCL
jgi:hypothetical protein